MTTPVNDWQPPEAKKVKTITSAIMWIGGITLGAFAITRIVPTWIAALDLVTKLTSNIIYLGMLVMGLILLGWLAVEMFSKDGKINKLFSQWYNSVINRMTWAMLEVDPISPLVDERKNMVQRKSIFDEAFAKFDGAIARLRQTEETYRENAQKAEAKGKAANARLANDPSMLVTRDTALYEAGRLTEAANNFSKMQQRLTPVRDTISRLRGALEQMINNIDIDIRIARDEWDAQLRMAEMDKSARGILQRKQQLAMDARQVIQDKYAMQIGRLENLKDITKPLLDSMDLDKATYSDQYLQNWQSQANAALQLAPPSAHPQPMQVGVNTSSKVGSLIR